MMIKYIYAIGLVFLFTSSTFAQVQAQTKQNPTETMAKKQTYYVEKLQLDREQAKSFKAINAEYEKDVKTLKIKSKNKKSLEKLKTLEKKRDEQLKGILSDKQFELYLKLRYEQRNSLKTLIRKSNGQ